MRLEDIHVGDVLRIREWDDMKSEFGLDFFGGIDCLAGFAPEMEYLCGKVFTVDHIDYRRDEVKARIWSREGYETCDFPENSRNITWIITSDMLEPLFEQNSVEELYDPISIDDLRNFLSFGANEVKK